MADKRIREAVRAAFSEGGKALADFRIGRFSPVCVVPEGVTRIEEKAFSTCMGIRSILLPNSLEVIESFAFCSCGDLEYVKIPANVREIGKAIFVDCAAFCPHLIIDIADLGAWCKIRGLQWNIPDLERAKFLLNGMEIKHIAIPEEVSYIGDCAFLGFSDLESVVIPDTVTCIGESAFYNCTSLKSVAIGKGVTSIGENAFGNCGNIKSVTMPDGVTRTTNADSPTAVAHWIREIIAPFQKKCEKPSCQQGA